MCKGRGERRGEGPPSISYRAMIFVVVIDYALVVTLGEALYHDIYT